MRGPTVTAVDYRERVEAALAKVEHMTDDVAFVVSGFVGLLVDYDAARARIVESHHVGEAEVEALAVGVAGRDLALGILHAIEQGRIATCSQLRDALILQASFHIPTNGGAHGLVSQYRTREAVRMLERVVAVAA